MHIKIGTKLRSRLLINCGFIHLRRRQERTSERMSAAAATAYTAAPADTDSANAKTGLNPEHNGLAK